MFLGAFNKSYSSWMKKGWVTRPKSASFESHSDLPSKAAK